MTVQEALSALKNFEQTSFALNHAMGILNYDGSTVAPKKSAVVRAVTQAESAYGYPAARDLHP